MPAPTPALSSSNKTGSKEKIDEFTNLNEDFSKRLPLQPLLSTISKKDKLSLDDLDEELDNNKKKWEKRKNNHMVVWNRNKILV